MLHSPMEVNTVSKQEVISLLIELVEEIQTGKPDLGYIVDMLEEAISSLKSE